MATAKPVAAAWHPWFKGALFALLSWNTASYLASGSPSEGLDSLAWLVLLALFELETGASARFREGRANTLLRAGRLVAAAALVSALAGYLLESAWLDAANMSLWIAVVGLLELGVRRPVAVLRYRRGFVAASGALFAGLAGLALAWLLRGEWFDAYDAALWLVAFATLEIGLLDNFRDGRARA